MDNEVKGGEPVRKRKWKHFRVRNKRKEEIHKL